MLSRLKVSSKCLLGVALVAIMVGLVWFTLPDLGVNPRELRAKVVALNPVLTFVFLALLPIFGFSIGIVYVVAGARFGSALGLVLIMFATVIHITGSYWIARSFLRRRIEAFLNKRKYHLPKLPETEGVSMALLAAFVPGLPYAARNYLLGIMRIPLRICLLVCLPIYLLRSSIAILLGELSGNLSYGTALLLGLFFCIKVGISAYLIKHLRD
ncbi:MAG: VTT domain-containing protein, partial [Verrucomicrobiales bacterium]|nr:VTT domain-containing protein [Verrucomicrobiales bacterium]